MDSKEMDYTAGVVWEVYLNILGTFSPRNRKSQLESILCAANPSRLQLLSSANDQATNFSDAPFKPNSGCNIPLPVIKVFLCCERDIGQYNCLITIGLTFQASEHQLPSVSSKRGQKQLHAGTQTYTDAVNNTSICPFQMWNLHSHTESDDESVACSSCVLHWCVLRYWSCRQKESTSVWKTHLW